MQKKVYNEIILQHVFGSNVDLLKEKGSWTHSIHFKTSHETEMLK